MVFALKFGRTDLSIFCMLFLLTRALSDRTFCRPSADVKLLAAAGGGGERLAACGETPPESMEGLAEPPNVVPWKELNRSSGSLDDWRTSWGRCLDASVGVTVDSSPDIASELFEVAGVIMVVLRRLTLFTSPIKSNSFGCR